MILNVLIQALHKMVAYPLQFYTNEIHFRVFNSDGIKTDSFPTQTFSADEVQYNVKRTVILTILIGRFGLSMEIVKSSFHSGLTFFFTTRVFTFCKIPKFL